jgi:hypothetical protein
MSFWGNSIRKVRFLAVLLILSVMLTAIPLSSSQAAVVGNETRQAINSAFTFFNKLLKLSSKSGQDFEPQTVLSQEERAARVTHFQLCPRHLSLYVGETFTLVPTPLGSRRETIHGVLLNWQSNNTSVANISPVGEVSALSPGLTTITVQAGSARAKVAVEVREGFRIPQTDEQWDAEHANDCQDPEKDPEDSNR